jgi:hypothetical protein
MTIAEPKCFSASPLSVGYLYRYSISLAPWIEHYSSALLSENAKKEFFIVLVIFFIFGKLFAFFSTVLKLSVVVFVALARIYRPSFRENKPKTL